MRAQRSDAELIAASLVDPHAFAPVFERHFATVHRYLARRGGRAPADDLAGEVFRIAFEHRDRFDTTYVDARPWLLGIATRLYFRAVRQNERASRAYGRARSAPPIIDGSYDDVDSRVAASAERALLAGAIESLTAGDRDALLLFAWEGMTYDEVARALQIPIGTVRSRIHRARRQLRELLRATGQYPCDQTAKR